MKRRTVLTGVAAIAIAATRRARAATPPEAAWPSALTMGTASPGGTYAEYGPAWGERVRQATGLAIAYRATQGPNENILLIDRAAIELGMTTLGVARQAWDGTGAWTGGTRLRTMRALFPMYDTPFHAIVPARSGLTDIAQLRGRTLGVGPASGTAGTYAPVMLRLLGVSGVTLWHGSMEAQAQALLAGQLDACLVAAGAPVPAFAAAETRAPLAFIGFTPAQEAVLAARLPELTRSIVPRGRYRGLGQDLATLGMFNFALCRHDLPQDLVYTAVRAVMSGNGLPGAGPMGAETLVGNVARDNFLPFHPGAARYYAERGQALPEALVVS